MNQDPEGASAQTPKARATARNRSAGVPPAVAGASRPRFGEVTIRDRGRLPHWEKDSATYFITFRLADSLPKSVLDQIESERQAIIKTADQLHRNLSPDERRKIQRLSTPVVERFLDSGAGTCYLQIPAIAEEVVHALHHFDAKRYRLFAWCVMANHVHVVARLFPGQTLAPSFTPGNPSPQNGPTKLCTRTAFSGSGSIMTISFEAKRNSIERSDMLAKTPQGQD